MKRVKLRSAIAVIVQSKEKQALSCAEYCVGLLNSHREEENVTLELLVFLRLVPARRMFVLSLILITLSSFWHMLGPVSWNAYDYRFFLHLSEFMIIRCYRISVVQKHY